MPKKRYNFTPRRRAALARARRMPRGKNRLAYTPKYAQPSRGYQSKPLLFHDKPSLGMAKVSVPHSATVQKSFTGGFTLSGTKYRIVNNSINGRRVRSF